MKPYVRYFQKWAVSRRTRVWFLLLIVMVFGLCCSAVSFGVDRALATDSVKSLLADIDQSAKKMETRLGEEMVPDFSAADQLTHDYRMAQTRYKLYECVLLAVFALVSLGMVLIFLGKKPNCSATHLVNASGLVFVVFGTLFLVLLADVDEQLNAGIGIMGAVAGYLFGTMRRSEETFPPDKKTPIS